VPAFGQFLQDIVVLLFEIQIQFVKKKELCLLLRRRRATLRFLAAR
jgi:hypothetical protein